MRGDGGDILSRLAPYARARHDGPDGIHLVLDGDSGPLRIVIVVDRQPDAPGTWFVIDDGHLTARLDGSGMATIWDADVLLWLAGQIVDALIRYSPTGTLAVSFQTQRGVG